MDLFTLLFTPAEFLQTLTHVIQTLNSLKASAESFEGFFINKKFSQSYLQVLVPVVGLEPTRGFTQTDFKDAATASGRDKVPSTGGTASPGRSAADNGGRAYGFECSGRPRPEVPEPHARPVAAYTLGRRVSQSFNRMFRAEPETCCAPPGAVSKNRPPLNIP